MNDQIRHKKVSDTALFCGALTLAFSLMLVGYFVPDDTLNALDDKILAWFRA
ncbi:MAG TPA: hypothetical protein VHL98_22500 [Microvirga sp.]|jgi:hypothetical protein|nr:hypothetical protein [Microvirga sp.]